LSDFFGFSYGYFDADTLLPGLGYWVKVSQDGVLYLDAEPIAKKRFNYANSENQDIGQIVVADGKNQKMVLYYSNGTSYTKKPLPPKPPAGLFDVRYSDDTYYSEVSSGKHISVSGAMPPITVTNVGGEIKLVYNVTNVSLLSDGQSITINEPVNTLYVQGLEIPTAYELFQNYPNPFNPSTNIGFTLPEAAPVKLMVINTLGETVQILADEYLTAGSYEYTFNAAGLPSGIYFYRIDTGTFSKVKKMLLLK
jgi:hypothetical protein